MGSYSSYPNIQSCRKFGCHVEKNKEVYMNLDGCPGCNATEKAKQEQRTKKYAEAKKYSDENKVHLVLYDDAEGNRQFMAFETARQANVIAVGYVYYVSGSNNG